VVGVLSERDVFRRHGQVGERTAARESVHRAMSTPAVTIDADQPVVAALELMLNRKIGCLPVLDRGVPSGIVTTTDILRHDADSSLERPATSLPPTVRAVMKRAPAVATIDTLLFDAAALMAARGVRHLPVVDGDHRVVGILSDRDLRRGVGDPGRFLECRDSNADPRMKMVGDLMTRDPITVEADAPGSGRHGIGTSFAGRAT
jgi:CBS domain-containing protein